MAIGPKAFEIWPSRADGTYSSYYKGSDLAFINNWDKEGYLNLPATSFPANQDIRQDVILPPVDNLIQDWGFEAGQLPSAAWLASGSHLPTVTNLQKHTGDYAAFLGLPFAFEPPTIIYNGSMPDFKPQIAQDESGTLHAIWGNGSNQAGQIYYGYRTVGSDWSVPQAITPGANNLTNVQWGVSDTGSVHIIWVSHGSSHDLLLHAWRDESGQWSNPQLVYGQGRITPIRLVVDDVGNAHLIWQLQATAHDDYYYANSNSNGNWSSPSPTGATGEYTVDDLAVGSNGQVHLLWRYSGDDISYSYRLPDGTWSSREPVYPGGYNWFFRIAATVYGQVHIVWSNVSEGRLYHRMRNPNGSWSSIKILSDNYNFSENGMEVMTTADGSVQIVWPGATGSNNCMDLRYARINRFGQWQGPESLPIGDRCTEKVWLSLNNDMLHIAFTTTVIPYTDASLCLMELNVANQSLYRCLAVPFSSQQIDIAVESRTLAYAIWQENDTVQFTETALVDEPSDSIIAQSVLLPDVSSYPTLSFVYLLDGADAAGGYLEVSVTDSVTSTSVYSTTATTTDWTHQWLDLSSWSSKSITLAIQVHQVVGAPHTSVYLDEVTLGTAYPDTWITLEAPNGIAPGWPVDIVVEYGNRGGVAAEEGVLTLTLPGEISFVSAQPEPTTLTPDLSWDLGQLPTGNSDSIVVTGQMAVESQLGDLISIFATLSTSSPELQLFNNEFERKMNVGFRLYLPFAPKG